MRFTLIAAAAYLVFAPGSGPRADTDRPSLEGPYLGQIPPGDSAQVFASGIVTTDRNEHLGPTFSRDGNVMVWTYFTRHKGIRHTRRVDDIWTWPDTVSFNLPFKEDGPYFSPVADRLFFFSQRPRFAGDDREDWDIWFVDLVDGSWSKPVNLGPPVNSARNEVFHAVTADGTIYFCTLGPPRVMYRSKKVGDRYVEPEKLPETINDNLFYSHPYVAPDESYMILSAERDDAIGSADLYVSFRNKSGAWTKPRNLGAAVNTEVAERSPCVTPDGKYLFFVRHQLTDEGGGYCCGDVYWVSANVIENPR